MAEKLKLGLDIGTSSVGWALLDEKNKLIRKNGHTFWGVRMFDEAKTAADRRSYRQARRRINRRRERVNIVRDLFAEEIYNVDPTFFERLDDSFLKQDDKRHNNYYNLFTSNYTDQDFFNEYPTIFHLRKALINEDKKYDIRMLYLAVEHIIKYRGNFLVAGDEFRAGDDSSIKESFVKLNGIINELNDFFVEDEAYMECYFDTIEFDDNFFDKLKKIMIDTQYVSLKSKG